MKTEKELVNDIEKLKKEYENSIKKYEQDWRTLLKQLSKARTPKIEGAKV